MGRFKLILIVGGAVLAFYGFKEWRLAGEVKAEPQTITCEALGRDGYGHNAHVQLTEFLVPPSSFVYEESKGGGWKTVWVPVVPLDGEYAEMLRALPEDAELPQPTAFHVILQTSHAANQAELDAIAEQDAVEGVVINEIDSLDKETKKLLREGYPGLDVDRCWIVEHGRKTKGTGTCLLLVALGLALAAGGVILFVRGGRRR